MEKTCKQCAKKFVVPSEDFEFYKKLAVKIGGQLFEMPGPSLCFFCRHQRRLAFRNEVNLYHRKCDKTGRQIISMYSGDKPFKIYDQHVWWSDQWDPLDYGRDFDFNRPFFEQFAELQRGVPRMSLNNIDSENSDYCNLALGNKNCYLAFTADNNEDSAYLRFADKNYRCFDCMYVFNSVDCYECLDVQQCNGCLYTQKSINSSGLYMCYDMIGCHDCIGCANLRNKQYYIFNQKCTREEYESQKSVFDLSRYSGYLNFKLRYEEFLLRQPRKCLELVNCENSLGDHLRDCRNAQMCYNGFGLEDCKYMINCWKAKDCYDWDFVAANGSELCHEMASCAYNMVNCHFCSGCWENCSDIYYCELCLRSKNLFGCIGLRNKQYCVFNKQYSKEDYELLVAKIILHMQSTGEWGEFFPGELSAYSYNETLAYEYFPLDKSVVQSSGWKWHDDEIAKMYKGAKYDLPDDLSEISDEICKLILICDKTGRAYKIIPQELKFCKLKSLPLPRLSPRERENIRITLRNPWTVYSRSCDKCSCEIKTTYSSKRPEPVYCEKCYQDILV